MGVRRGLALLLVVGVLGILGVLATTFVTLARLERRASLQRIHASKALLLARSGIEDALARLDAGQDPEGDAARYGGEDWDGDGVLGNLPEEQGSEVYRSGLLDTDACPARHAVRPSFFRSLAANPKTVLVEGRRRGYSGSLGTEQAHYALRARRGGIYVNGGELPLRRVLGILAESLDREDGLDNASPVDEADGWALVDLRPPQGWTGIAQVGASLGQAKAEALESYLAFRAWVDPKVIAPTPAPVLAAMEGSEYQTWADIRLGRVGVSANPGAPPTRTAPGFEARSPVDLAWARHHRPALIALMAGLKGLYLDETASIGGEPGGQDCVGHLRAVEVELDWTQASDSCRTTADRILQSTGGLDTWQAWDAFCDTLVFTGTSDQVQARRDLLKANFNPNSDLNKFNPDRPLARLLDKSDLMVYSTEFSLPACAGVSLSSVGRVTDASGRLLASRGLSAGIAPPQRVVLTTQEDFTALRTYGAPLYLSESAGTSPTFGHRLALGGFLDGSSNGVSLQTAPEPHTAAPAAYDGQVRLATVELADGAWGPTMMFLARWDLGVDADLGGSTANQADTSQPPDGNPLWHPTAPGSIHGDGLYLEKGRQPGYRAAGNMAARRGTCSFWVKPNYDPERAPWGDPIEMDATRARLYFNHTRNDGVNPINTACLTFTNAVNFFGGMMIVGGPRGFSMHTENSFGSNADLAIETIKSTGQRSILPHRWYLMNLLWDLDQSSTTLGQKIFVDRGLAAGDSSPPTTYAATLGVPAIDFTQPDGYLNTTDLSTLPPAVFHLGRRGHLDGTAMGNFGAPDATFDEFAIYDLGAATGSAGDAMARTADLAVDRFEEGRYYKENDGAYVTAPIDLGPVPVRLDRMAWTQRVPRALQAPPGPNPEDGDLGPDGRITWELLDATGISLGTLFTEARGQAVRLAASAPLRLRARFEPNLDVATMAGTALLEPLILDDLSLFYVPEGGSRIAEWQPGE